jgi:hypothetical protein
MASMSSAMSRGMTLGELSTLWLRKLWTRSFITWETTDSDNITVMSIWDDHHANMLWLDSTYPTPIRHQMDLAAHALQSQASLLILKLHHHLAPQWPTLISSSDRSITYSLPPSRVTAVVIASLRHVYQAPEKIHFFQTGLINVFRYWFLLRVELWRVDGVVGVAIERADMNVLPITCTYLVNLISVRNNVHAYIHVWIQVIMSMRARQTIIFGFSNKFTSMSVRQRTAWKTPDTNTFHITTTGAVVNWSLNKRKFALLLTLHRSVFATNMTWPE